MSGVDVSSDVHGKKGPAVDVGSIEHELAQLWRMPTVVGLRETDIVPTRTSVLNLVVHSSDAATSKRAGTIINELASNHPSRVISFMPTADPHAFDDDIDAHVSTHCHTATGERFASCYEKIEIKAPPDSLDELPSLIVALAVPDLPTFIWWPGQPPLDDPRFPRVALAANRLIIDSLDFTNCAENVIRSATLCRDVGERCAISDLNWARLGPWRSMMSQFFDKPEFNWALRHVTDLQLEYGQAPDKQLNAAQPMLFAGWLASRLSWDRRIKRTERHEHGTCSTVDQHGQPIDIMMRGREVPSRFNGYLLGATLLASNGGDHASFEIIRIGDDLSTVKMTATLNGNLVIEHAMRSEPA
ncbi:MAG TPA: glucose-6-phosphate dehydrogenase assembly protein OpcA, partial [Nitrolancea sp.]|nr:glucose-6-phosphate dehydrogenase assembly protein OpcA [Nitrolancea sp.]